MSLSINNAYRFRSTVTVPAFCRALTPVVDPVWRQLAIRAVALVALILARDSEESDEPKEDHELLAEAVKGISGDQVAVGRLGSSFRLLSQAADIVDEVQLALKRPAARRVFMPVDLTMSVAFLDDPGDAGWTYAILYTEAPELRDVFRAIPGVEEYDYDDRSDAQLEEMSEEEWRHRRDVWERVLGPSLRPAESCATWSYPFRYGLAVEAIMGHTNRDGSWLTAATAVGALEPLMDRSRPMTQKRREELLAAFDGKPLRTTPNTQEENEEK